MIEEVAVLEPQEDADASSEETIQIRQPGRDPKTGQFVPVGYVDDSIDTSPTLEAEAEEEPEEEPESEADPSPAVDDADDKSAEVDPDLSPSAQARIDEVIGNYRGEQRKNADLQLQLDEANANRAKPEVEPLKTFEDFGFDGPAYSAYIMERSMEAADARVGELLEKHTAKQDVLKQGESFKQAEDEFAKQHPDYHQKVYGEVDGIRTWAASDAMAQEIRLADNGQALAYHLASNPDIADKITAMSPRDTVVAMFKLSGSLREASAKVKAEKDKVTKAPPPPPKLKGGEAEIKTTGYHDGMTDAQFDAKRRKEIANR